MSKKLLQSKKARSAWLGGVVVTLATVGMHKLGMPESLITSAITAIAGLFGSQILGQAYQDGKENEGPNVNSGVGSEMLN